MIRVIISQDADEELDEILEQTKKQWGEDQVCKYLRLVKDAIAAIAKNPRCGRSYPGVQPNILGYPIRQSGKPARHILFYRIDSINTVVIVHFFHDKRDFANLL